jgi:hypothetical protein
MPPAELKAISQSRKDLSIKILPADMRDATVVMETEQYNNISELSSSVNYSKHNYN